MGAASMAITAIEATHFCLGERFVFGSETGLFRFHHNRSTDAVATHTHRRHTRIDLHLTYLAWIKVRQRRIHMIGARRRQVHAVHQRTHAVIRHAVDHGQAGHATST